MTDLPETNAKRKVLLSILRLCDPLGWLAPLTIVYKIFMRTLWEKDIDWDSTLPNDLLKKWIEMYNSLKQIHIIEIPMRLIISRDVTFFEIHGFSDASMSAYSAVVYAKVCSCTRDMTRLELCGAQLLVRLTNHVCKALRLSDLPIHLWCDSTNVLYGIRA